MNNTKCGNAPVRTIRLTKSEMAYYRALKTRKAEFEAKWSGGPREQLLMEYLIEPYERLCKSINALRAKGSK